MGFLNTANVAAPTAPAAPQGEAKASYRRIFKSTALIGGTQVLTTIIAIGRTKALAVWLGPAGMGLAGLYMSAIGFVGALTGLGIGSSGVRQIAEAAASGDSRKVARTVTTLRFTSLGSGLVGMLLVLALSRLLSKATFGDEAYAWGIAIVSVTLLLGGVSSGQIALLQGLRRLRDMAKAQVVGAVFGALVSVLLVYFLRERGVPWFLAAISAFGVLTSWWFARRVKVERAQIRLREIVAEARGLLGMGMAFMAAGLISGGLAYLSRVLVTREFALEGAGLYQATWTLSAYYVGFVLGAMSADFCPRLTAVAGDNTAVNRLVNEQVEIGVLIALPGVLATLVAAPWVLHVFYSGAFVAAADIVRWQVVGVFLRVVSWPLAMVMLAKGKGTLFVATEAVAAVIQIAFLVACMSFWRLEGMGVAFAASYVAYTLGMMAVCCRISRFAWSRRSRKVISASLVAVALTFLATRLLPNPWSVATGVMLVLSVSAGCLVGFQKLLQINPWQLLKHRLGFNSAA